MSDSENSEVGEAKTFTLQTAAFDARFPNQNQTKHCWQNYVDFYKCAGVRGADDSACKQFYRAFHSLCPNEWIAKWDEQREGDAFPHSLDP
ncbi:putative COX12-cytochrome-c oxidase, subunit VIB [Meira miltonrushii]|uniref:Cytochrome c oxidase subunit n=1 Tax=Meira miltonrushii TaxID=1280837 RepID=A0A316VNE6_9BASI|nr:putative COX12-cytochrome-c oxidase, subunit VIB [Meira miltonrushii]PWN37631.1 putative COX12-cytochrome-c oxidase, subunit VIB [Meira miltonrushii]